MNYSDYADQGQAQVMAVLEEKLSAQQWREADELTKIIMIKTSNHKDGNCISLDIDNFPTDVLEKIDELWKKNSNYYFGFSIQKSIYNQENYQQFIANVGWYQENSWLSYADVFSWKTALKGHLPYCGLHFWQPVYTGSFSSHSSSLHQSHFHRPHYHPPHRHNSGESGAAAALGAAALAATPWLIGVAAVGGAAYLIHRELTKEERKRQERLEREAEKKREEQRRLEEENRVQKNIKSLLALI